MPDLIRHPVYSVYSVYSWIGVFAYAYLPLSPACLQQAGGNDNFQVFIPRTATTYAFSMALSINSCVVQSRNRLLLRDFTPCSWCSLLTEKTQFIIARGIIAGVIIRLRTWCLVSSAKKTLAGFTLTSDSFALCILFGCDREMVCWKFAGYGWKRKDVIGTYTAWPIAHEILDIHTPLYL